MVKISKAYGNVDVYVEGHVHMEEDKGTENNNGLTIQEDDTNIDQRSLSSRGVANEEATSHNDELGVGTV